MSLFHRHLYNVRELLEQIKELQKSDKDARPMSFENWLAANNFAFLKDDKHSPEYSQRLFEYQKYSDNCNSKTHKFQQEAQEKEKLISAELWNLQKAIENEFTVQAHLRKEMLELHTHVKEMREKLYDHSHSIIIDDLKSIEEGLAKAHELALKAVEWIKKEYGDRHKFLI